MDTRAWGIAAMGIVMVAAFVLYFWGLGSAPLQDYDEATYAQVVREEVASVNWLSFTHAGEADRKSVV